MNPLERAIAIALEVHAGVVDKAGAPYILHPLRVMLSLSTTEERIVGVLHDVVEDGKEKGWDFSRLRQEGYSETVLDALASVTKRGEDEDPPGHTLDTQADKVERYLRFVARAKANPIGKRVKMADLRDNLDASRIAQLTERDVLRMAKYREALEFLDRP